MSLDIRLYDSSMRSDVGDLFALQYGVPKEQFCTQMDQFYGHTFQKEESIRIVAVDNGKVVGFQSFFYWPYLYRGKLIRSFQSGNSLVHPSQRGKGIFAMLLRYLDEEIQINKKIDLLMGFPVEQSRNSFLRNGWQNITDLEWWVKPVNPLSILLPDRLQLLHRFLPDLPTLFPEKNNLIALADSTAFRSWRETYRQDKNYFWFRNISGKEEISCSLKLIHRKKLLKELIIGDVRTNSENKAFIQESLLMLESIARKSFSVTFLSIAFNPKEDSVLPSIIRERGFRKIKKKIYFIIKPFNTPKEFSVASNWRLFRNDIDTW